MFTKLYRVDYTKKDESGDFYNGGFSYVTDCAANAVNFAEVVFQPDSITVTYQGEYELQNEELWITDEDIFCGTGQEPISMEEVERLLDELSQDLKDEEKVFNRYYQITVCYHRDGEVNETEIGFITDSDEHAREFATAMYGVNGVVDRDNGTTTWSIAFKGYVKAREIETIIGDEDLVDNYY